MTASLGMAKKVLATSIVMAVLLVLLPLAPAGADTGTPRS